MENAVRFDQQSNVVYVKNRMAMNDNQGVELCTVVKAMHVSLNAFSFSSLFDFVGEQS